MERTPKGETVRLGRLEAFRYSNLRPKGFAGELTLYTVPTTGGVATVACTGRAQGTPLSDCEDVAGSLKVTEGGGVPDRA